MTEKERAEFNAERQRWEGFVSFAYWPVRNPEKTGYIWQVVAEYNAWPWMGKQTVLEFHSNPQDAANAVEAYEELHAQRIFLSYYHGI